MHLSSSCRFHVGGIKPIRVALQRLPLSLPACVHASQATDAAAKPSSRKPRGHAEAWQCVSQRLVPVCRLGPCPPSSRLFVTAVFYNSASRGPHFSFQQAAPHPSCAWQVYCHRMSASCHLPGHAAFSARAPPGRLRSCRAAASFCMCVCPHSCCFVPLPLPRISMPGQAPESAQAHPGGVCSSHFSPCKG